jgi:hypothetical protein
LIFDIGIVPIVNAPSLFQNLERGSLT